MRVSAGVLAKGGRRPQKEPFPFQQILPLKLKGSVSGKGDKSSSVACLQDMSLLFVCLRNNDFQEAKCTKEIEAFQQCYRNHLQARADTKERAKRGVVAIGTKDLGHREINEILKKYPPL